MSTRRRIDITEGIAALHHWRNLYQQGQDTDRNTTATAVRYTLEELAAKPGWNWPLARWNGTQP